MKLGTFRQTPQEKKRFSISYSAWLDTGEEVASITYAISPTTTVPLIIEGSALDGDGLGVTVYVSVGEDATEYRVGEGVTVRVLRWCFLCRTGYTGSAILDTFCHFTSAWIY